MLGEIVQTRTSADSAEWPEALWPEEPDLIEYIYFIDPKLGNNTVAALKYKNEKECKYFCVWQTNKNRMCRGMDEPGFMKH